MSRISIGILFLLFFSSCQQKSSNDRAGTGAIKKDTSVVMPRMHLSVLDSLQKYSGTDSLYLEYKNSDEMIFIGKANNVEYGAWMIYDDTNSQVVFYQKASNSWKATDTIENQDGALCYFSRADLNGDGFQDIKISTVNGAHGNYETVVYLFDPKSHLFKNNVCYDLTNVSYDPVRKYVRSIWYGSVAGCQEKTTYKIVADSLVFHEGVMYCPDNEQPSTKASLEFYTMRYGERITLRKIVDDPQKLWDKYTSALWDTSKD